MRRALRNGEEIRAVCEAINRPVNVLAHPGLTMAEAVEAGAQRVSVGGSLAWVAAEAMAASAETMRDQGDFSSLTGSARIGEWFGAERPRRSRALSRPGSEPSSEPVARRDGARA